MTSLPWRLAGSEIRVRMSALIYRCQRGDISHNVLESPASRDLFVCLYDVFGIRGFSCEPTASPGAREQGGRLRRRETLISLQRVTPLSQSQQAARPSRRSSLSIVGPGQMNFHHQH